MHAGAAPEPSAERPAVDQVLEQADPVIYVCGCPGYSSHVVEDMCLRCLDAYATGIQTLLSKQRLVVEMERVARALLRHVQNGPRVSVDQALKAADRGLHPAKRPVIETAR